MIGMILVVAGCASKPADPLVNHVMIVANRREPDSVEIARYYLKRRQIPEANLVMVDAPPVEEIPQKEYAALEDQVRRALQVRKNIDYLVLTKYVPLRIREGGYSVDAHLATIDSGISEIRGVTEAALEASQNPYFDRNSEFSHRDFGIYLVTRLEGFTKADAERLVDNSLAAEKSPGLFYFHGAVNRTREGYGPLQDHLARATDVLRTKGFKSRYDMSSSFPSPSEALAGYASWGSNDRNFHIEAYHRLRFQPGALAETFVSTSARTFLPTTGGQSLIADLVQQGVTGVKGYVHEPFTFAMARPDILFDRYTSGFNLAESFYMASPIARWKDVVIGDPLCRPYKIAD